MIGAASGDTRGLVARSLWSVPVAQVVFRRDEGEVHVVRPRLLVALRPLHDWRWRANWRRWQVRGRERRERWTAAVTQTTWEGPNPVPLSAGWSRAPARGEPGGGEARTGPV